MNPTGQPEQIKRRKRRKKIEKGEKKTEWVLASKIFSTLYFERIPIEGSQVLGFILAIEMIGRSRWNLNFISQEIRLRSYFVLEIHT